MDKFYSLVEKIFSRSKSKKKYAFFSNYFNVDIEGYLSWKQVKKGGYKVASHLVLLIGYPPFEGDRYEIKRAYIIKEGKYILLVYDTKLSKYFLVKWEKSKIDKQVSNYEA